MKNKAIRFFKKYHSIFSFVIAIPIILFSVSGIILNHREQFSSTDVSRGWLPAEYHYGNWNNASVKGSVTLSADSALVFGNVGVYLATDNYSKFTDFNNGFASGADNHKIFDLLKTSNNAIYAGTLYGLFTHNSLNNEWQKIKLPIHNERIVSLVEKDSALYVFTRSELFKLNLNNNLFAEIKLPRPENYDNKIGMFKTLWVIHSGEIFGAAGKILVDIVAVIMIVLCVTGIVFFVFRKYFKEGRFKIEKLKRVAYKKNNMKWHNQIGLYTSIILIITTLTGIFLRPPLLIPIANKKVGKISYTELDSPNPWFDKIRGALYDKQMQRWVFASADGVYFSDDNFNSELKMYEYQAPISVMGINVLKPMGNGEYLIGSFSGLYRWMPNKYAAQDYLTGEFLVPQAGLQKPFGNLAVAGFITNNFGQEFLFDYNSGVLPLQRDSYFAAMPETIADDNMSLWNFALEFHTGRIYNFLIGPFYILVVPLTGIFMLFLIFSGVYLWYKMYYNKQRNIKTKLNKQAA